MKLRNFLETSDVTPKMGFLIKKRVTYFFSITQPSNSVNMMLSVGKTDMQLTPWH